MLGEDAVAVAVQRQRHAVLGDVAAQHGQVALGGLGGIKPRGQHAPGGVVDEGCQAALGPARLEPVVVAAVDLHQFAQTLPARSRWMHALGSPGLGLPQPRADHPASQGLGAVRKAVLACQVLARQLRAEVGVVLAHQAQRVLAHLCGNAPVAGYASPLRYQAAGTLLAQPSAQALDLPNRQVQLLRGLRLAQRLALHPLQHPQALRLSLTHQRLSLPLHPTRSRCTAQGTLLLGAKGTLLFGAHMVAIAAKNARMAWAVLTRGESFKLPA